MQPHHEAWLSAHPHRTEEWFRDRMRDGFDVHHLDGNHNNNDPANLVLIEHTDHMALHNGGTYTLGRLRWSPRPAHHKKKARALREYEAHKARLAAYCEELRS